MNDKFWIQLTKLDRKSAIVARGITQAYEPTFNKLRDCQQAALDLADELGVAITGTSLTSKIGRLLRDAGVFEQFAGKPRRGEGYVLEAGPRYEDFLNFLENNDLYGSMSRTEVNDLQAKSAILDALEVSGSIMLDASDHRVDSKTYKALRDFLNDGKLKVVYVRPDTEVVVKTKNAKKFRRAEWLCGE